MASDKRVIDGSSIVEMEIVGEDDSDYEVDLSGPDQRLQPETSDGSRRRPMADDHEEGELSFMEATKGQVASGVASYVWEEGRERAKKAFSVYGNIDILRPYFDVEPRVVRNRLIHSLIPKLPKSGSQEKVPRELYGPTMVVFTMIALLLFQMKTSGHTVQEGTLMGTAFGVCFTYWFGVSSLLWFLSYVCNTHITMLQILSLVGYALFGHCVALFLGTAVHAHFMFYVLWLVFGGLSSLRMISILFARTAGKSQRIAVCAIIAALHMLFLLYLHFAYHQIVEDISLAMGGAPVEPKMAALDVQAGDILPDEIQHVNKGIDPNAGLPLADQAVKAVTESVKRVIREAVIPNQPIRGHDSNSSLVQAGSKLLEALAPQNLENGLHEVKQGFQHAMNGTMKIVHKALNDTQLV